MTNPCFAIVLTQILLKRNNLSGKIPLELSSLRNLKSLDLSFNHLSGNPFPAFSSLPNLQGLQLSHNQLIGSIPKDMPCMTPSLSKLDLSYNNFNGTLPSWLFKKKFLSQVDVSENRFFGPTPCEQTTYIVNYSGNLLTPRACNSRPPVSRNGRVLSKSFWVIIEVCSTLVFVLLGVCCLLVISKIYKEKNVGDEEENNNSPVRAAVAEPVSINLTIFKKSLRKISTDVCADLVDDIVDDIRSATDNFNESYVIGRGGFGTVYRAILKNYTVAIKKINNVRNREFQAEMETVGEVSHENLVPLLGYSADEDDRFLIYEYMPRGSLDASVSNLDWPTRFRILLDSARGIHFLHHGFVSHIIHRDIKSSNILLDGRLRARVSNFGLARVINDCKSHTKIWLAGSLGYITPE